jgi:5-methylcytosine-specific restriction endonuclease McrA
MGWTLEDDAAWIRISAHAFRHYCGARIELRGRSWVATSVDGHLIPGNKTPLDALEALLRRDPFFRYFPQFGKELCFARYGPVEHRLCPIGRDDKEIVFVFYLPQGEELPSFIQSTIEKRLFPISTCVSCNAPMSPPRRSRMKYFDGPDSEEADYLTCPCGCPVWRTEANSYNSARHAMDLAVRAWQRRQGLKAAGGRHSEDEISEIFLLQNSRCIYCTAKFSGEVCWEKDHIIPVTKGGSNWAINIVLACTRCNRRRSNMPFLTFCMLMSPSVNKRIMVYLKERFLSMRAGRYPKAELARVKTGLTTHDPQDLRLQLILASEPISFKNTKRNWLLRARYIREFGA